MEKEIMSMTIAELLDIENLYKYSSELPVVQKQIKGLYLARLNELNAPKELVKQVLEIFKELDNENKQYEADCAKSEALSSFGMWLETNASGKPLSTIDNFLTVMQNDTYFENMRFNQLTGQLECIKNGELVPWCDTDDAEAKHYIEKKYKIRDREAYEAALKVLQGKRGYHPIKQIIEAVEWDKKPRIETLFIKWLKCDDTKYTREVTRLVFAGGIHRLYNPGCKFDDVAVLIGTHQGEGKSTFIRWLAIKDEFYTELTEIEGQKGIEAIESAWICEIAELLAVTKTKDVEAVKSYITKLVDKYRKPYDKRITNNKRQCIFIGTTNKEQFLTDKTGNRRWYPLKVVSNGYELHKKKDEIQADILQAWAEAKELYDKGLLKPYANQDLIDEIRAKQSEAVEEDYRIGLIEDYLKDKDRVCIFELWKEALDNPNTKPTRKDSNEIALILQSMKDWERCPTAQRYGEYGVQMLWLKKSSSEEEFELLP